MSIDLAKEDKQILKSIYENSKMGIAVYNFVNDSFEIVNEAFTYICDYSEDELIEMPLNRLFNSKCISQLKTDEKSIFLTTHLKKDASSVELLIDIMPIKIENNKVKKGIITIFDVSNYNLQKIKQELNSAVKKEQKFIELNQTIKSDYLNNNLHMAIFENSSDIGICAFDASYRYLTFNDKYERSMFHILGKKIELGMNILELIPSKSDKELVKKHIDRALLGDSFVVESNYEEDSFSRKYWRIFYSPIFSDQRDVIGVSCFNIDITEDKETKIILHEMDAKHSLIFNESQVALSIYSLERFVFIEVNRSFISFTGYTRDEIIESPDISLWVDKKERDRFFKEIQTVEKIENFEFLYQRKDGTVRNASLSATLIELNGEWCILSEIYDVTDKKAQEEQLLLKNFALDKINEAAYLIDENSMFHYVNEAASRDLGYSKEELLTMGIIHIDPTSSIKWWKERWKDIKKQGMALTIREHKRKDGTLFPMEVSSNYLEYNGMSYVLAIVRDISKLKAHEEKLLEQNQFLDSLLNAIPVPVFFKDTETRYKGFNKAFEEFYGKTKEELIGKGVFDLFPKEQAQVFFDADAELFREGTTQTYEAKLRDVKGNNHDVMFHKAVYRDKEGNISGQIGTILDITERKTQEEALAQKEHEYHTMTNNIPDNIARWDTKGCYLYINTTHEQTIQMSVSEVIGKSITTLLPDHTEVINALFYLIESGNDSITVFQTLLNNKAEIETHEVKLISEKNSEGELISILGIGRDITKRIKQDELLHQKEEEFRTLVENSHDTIARFNKECCRTYVNPAFEQMFGQLSKDVIGKKPSEITPVTDALVFEKLLLNVFETAKEYQGEISFINYKGENCIGYIHLVPEFSKDGQVINVLCIGHDITEKKRLEETLSKREREFRALAEQTPDTIARYDKDCVRLYANPAFAAISGINIEDLIGIKPTSHNNSENAIKYEEKIKRVFETGLEDNFQLTWTDKLGRLITSHIRIVPEIDEKGIISVLAIGRDITHIKEHEIRLKEAQKMAKVGSWELEFPSLQLHLSEEVYRIFEINPDENNLSYKYFFNFVHPEDREFVDKVYVESLKNKTEYDIVHRLLLANGKIKYVHEKWKSIYNEENNILRLIGTIQDITEQKTIENKIEHMAHHDALTGLPNRLVAINKTEEAIVLAKRNNSKIGLIFFDLDGFKTINDSMGHSVGDMVLKAVASRIKNVLRKTDTISRQGGDEFLIILPDINSKDEIISIVEKLILEFEKQFEVGSHFVSATASIGIACYPEHGDSFESLFKNVDAAMYKAKEFGKNTYHFFTKQMQYNIIGEFKIQNDLKNAILNNEFVLHYQPQIDSNKNKIIGAEALIRWKHPEMGMIPPLDFISIAEANGLIVNIGEWVLNEACKQAVLWSKEGINITIAVNISAVQFKRGNLVDVIKNALISSGLEPRFLELELTESIMINDVEMVLKTVHNLKELGVQLSIDDFGTGYSSLAYLKRFAVDKLKIDQSFIKDILNDKEDAVIVKTIIQMAKNLNLKTIAEGVENQQIYDSLKALGCDVVQGYHFAKPMASTEFIKYTKNFS